MVSRGIHSTSSLFVSSAPPPNCAVPTARGSARDEPTSATNLTKTSMAQGFGTMARLAVRACWSMCEFQLAEGECVWHWFGDREIRRGEAVLRDVRCDVRCFAATGAPAAAPSGMDAPGRRSATAGVRGRRRRLGLGAVRTGTRPWRVDAGGRGIQGIRTERRQKALGKWA